MGKLRQGILLFLAVSSAVSFGDECKDYYNSLVESPTRPKMEEVALLISVCPGWKAGSQGSFRIQRLREGTEFPLFIAALERAFPGGVYYSLGRDAVLVGDILDAFYLGLGQPGRSRRLDVSHPSFRTDDSLVDEFLVQNDINPGRNKDPYPRVAFDVTSFSKYAGVGGGASQSVRVVQAGFRLAKKNQINLKSLPAHFNFVSIGGGSFYKKAFDDPQFDLADFVHAQRATVVDREFDFPAHCNLMNYAYTGEWHGLFGPIKEMAGGKVGTEPGEPYSLGSRRDILNEMIGAYQIATDPRFRGAVRVAAQTLGFNFPMERRLNHTMLSPQERQRVAKILDQLRVGTPATKKIEEPTVEPVTKKSQEPVVEPAKGNTLTARGAENFGRFQKRLESGLWPDNAAQPFFEDLCGSSSFSDFDVYWILSHVLASAPEKKFKRMRDLLVAYSGRSARLFQLLKDRDLSEIWAQYPPTRKRVTRNQKAVVAFLSGDCSSVVAE